MILRWKGITGDICLQVAQQCKENIFAIQTLSDFQHMEDNKDLGANVREKAKVLMALLKDDERLKNERAKALKAKERYTENFGIGSDSSSVSVKSFCCVGGRCESVLA